MPFPVLGSVARRARIGGGPIDAITLPRERWRSGDVVLGEVLRSGGALGRIESADGRLVEVLPGDTVVGAFGRRHATLEATGDWEAIGEDLRFQALTAAGVFGRCSSIAKGLGELIELRYAGHIRHSGSTCNIADFAVEAPARPLETPVVLLIGTSMEAGKTVSGKTIVRRLNARGARVGGAKLTGVGRYKDILALRDAGAELVLDFVDGGLPSTACPREVYEPALDRILAAFAAARLDVLVAEAGASPLEPYNGDAAMERLAPDVVLTVLCASDPYAVVGVMEAFGVRPDIVAGRCTSTIAGIELVERLSGVQALNLIDPASNPRLDELLERALR